jgi:hypothetical protein
VFHARSADNVSIYYFDSLVYLLLLVYIHIFTKSRLNSENACCHSVQSLSSFRLFRKNLKLKIYKTIILPLLYVCESWSLTLREEHRLNVSENRMLRRIFGPKREEVAGGWRRLHNEELLCALRKILLG